jgi:hypothetical protein
VNKCSAKKKNRDLETVVSVFPNHVANPSRSTGIFLVRDRYVDFDQIPDTGNGLDHKSNAVDLLRIGGSGPPFVIDDWHIVGFLVVRKAEQIAAWKGFQPSMGLAFCQCSLLINFLGGFGGPIPDFLQPCKRAFQIGAASLGSSASGQDVHSGVCRVQWQSHNADCRSYKFSNHSFSGVWGYSGKAEPSSAGNGFAVAWPGVFTPQFDTSPHSLFRGGF